MKFKNCLILIAENSFKEGITELIKSYFDLFVINYKVIYITNKKSLDNIQYKDISCIDIVYFIGHSNHEVFGDDSLNFTWSELSLKIKSMNFICDNSTIIFESCESYNPQMYKSIFDNCKKIDNILSYETDLEHIDGILSLVILIYLLQIKNIAVTESLERIRYTTNSSIRFIDRKTYKTINQ